MRIQVDIDPGKILRVRGLGDSLEAKIYLAERFKLYCDPYVPMRSGPLKNTAQVVTSGKAVSVQYVQPYSHYQYAGRTMGPNVFLGENIGWRSMAPKGGKYYTGSSLKYSGGGLRGKEWDKRMMADRKHDLTSDLAEYVGGTPK